MEEAPEKFFCFFGGGLMYKLKDQKQTHEEERNGKGCSQSENSLKGPMSREVKFLRF